jgi:predicted DNA-binding protein
MSISDDSEEEDKPTSVRLGIDLKRRLESEAQMRRQNRSEAARELLELGLGIRRTDEIESSVRRLTATDGTVFEVRVLRRCRDGHVQPMTSIASPYDEAEVESE